ncbi:MAG TPA: CocE/NonD family hydrolase [Candidatus Rubrimentiphilum sp.]|nr:CocE/NonD family hydrolase [Candidatus Rubrimentiphilum sp.]
MTRFFAILAFGLLGAASPAPVRDYVLPTGGASSMASSMTVLARGALAHGGSARVRDPDDLFRLQITAGDYDGAEKTLQQLRRASDHSLWGSTNYSQFEIFVAAKKLERAGRPFNEAFKREFRKVLGKLDDRHAAVVIRRFELSAPAFQSSLSDALRRARGESPLHLEDVVPLIRAYQLAQMYESFDTLTRALILEDDERRYIINRNFLIQTPDGAHICATIARPRHSLIRLPALLQFTIYADKATAFTDVRRSASNDYVGAVAFTRGKGCSPDAHIVPYEHDGADAAAIINWIAAQPWSDGRVGMFGGSYNSFTQWATAKRLPLHLKALMTAVSNAPGIDTPMEANVFESWDYYWPLYVTDGKWLDATSAGDPARWTNLQKRWYLSGKSYRAMATIDGTPNPIWDRWLDHPSYDHYWQGLIPYKAGFGHIHIPVLMVDGYLNGQNVGGYYYFSEYQKYSPHAEKYLVLGPYDHIRAQRGTMSSVGRDVTNIAGYDIDAAARIDVETLRYEWFDYVLKRAKKPAILRDKVDYEVMGANMWKHAPSIAAMGGSALSLWLNATPDGRFHRLGNKAMPRSFVLQTVDFKDRSDVNRTPPANGLDMYLASGYLSGPFKRGFSFTGVFSGMLDFSANKRDFDFNIAFFELNARGDYTFVTNYQARASYVMDRSQRHLLVPGKRTRLAFTSSRITSWKFHPGSRMVVLVSIPKDPGVQINYGTGKNVSDESIADAKIPLQIKWYGDSILRIPGGN